MVEIATKTIKIGQNQAKRMKFGKKVLGTRFRTPNPKPKMLFSIFTLVRNLFIKVLSEKKLYLQSFWEFGSFLFFVKFNDKKGRYPRKHPHWRATVNYSAWKPSANILRTLLEFQKAIGTEVLLKVVVLPKYAWTKWVEIRIVTIPLSPNIDSPFSKFLKPEILKSDKWFCPSCNCLTESTRETSIISFGSILVIQLSQFSTSHSRLIKDQQVFNCSPDLDLKVPITVEDEVSFSTKYSLMASINHSGTLD